MPGVVRRLSSGCGWLCGLGEMSCWKECLALPATGAEVDMVIVVKMICKVPGEEMTLLSPDSVSGQALCYTLFPHIISFSAHNSLGGRNYYFLKLRYNSCTTKFTI